MKKTKKRIKMKMKMKKGINNLISKANKVLKILNSMQLIARFLLKITLTNLSSKIREKKSMSMITVTLHMNHLSLENFLQMTLKIKVQIRIRREDKLQQLGILENLKNNKSKETN